MLKYKFVILENESPEDSQLWINACEKNSEKVSYRIVSLISNDWLYELRKEPFDYALSKPGGQQALYKQLYDERLGIIVKDLKYNVFPTLEEVGVYENKRYLRDWLMAHELPHPASYVFYNKNEALEGLKTISFPLVAKFNIGASGSGVRILKSEKDGIGYIEEAFSDNGLSRQWGPDANAGAYWTRIKKYLLNPSLIKEKMLVYAAHRSEKQKGFVFLQEFVKHDFEWRVVRIGESFFAHKKLVNNGKASGALLKEYGQPPMQLLDFVRDFTDEFGFFSQAVDVFEDGKGNYLLNEVQCIFGQSDDYQMKIDEKIGRYIFKEGCWCFEEGDYCGNECYNMRVLYLLNKLSAEKV